MALVTSRKPGWTVPALVVVSFHLLLAAIPLHFSEAHTEEPPPIQLTLAEPAPLKEPDLLETLPEPLPEPPEVEPPPEIEPPPEPPPVPVVDNEPVALIESPVAVATEEREIPDEMPPEVPLVEEPREEDEEPPIPDTPIEPLPEAEPAPRTPPAPPVDWNTYGRGVMQAVESEIDYPRMALRRNLEGTAQVRIAVAHDGRLAGPPKITSSTGHAILDREVLRMVEAAAPFTAFPGHAEEQTREFVIPVRFRIR